MLCRSHLAKNGEIDTAHPGYLGSQDTFYVGTLKGVGRIYQQTYVDTYAKTAQAKLYTTKTPITAADMLNDKVLPSTSFTICRCCASSPTGEPSIADAPSVTITSCSWPQRHRTHQDKGQVTSDQRNL